VQQKRKAGAALASTFRGLSPEAWGLLFRRGEVSICRGRFMCRRVLAAWSIIVTLMLGSVAHVRGQGDEQQREQEQVAQSDDEKLTAEEEREAVQIAEQFVKGFEEKNQLSEVIDRLYVKDFDARLRAELNNYTYLVKVEPDVAAQASPEELRRLYAVSLGFWYKGGLLTCIRMYNKKLAGDDSNDDPSIKELLPANVVAVMKTDPVTAELLAEDERESPEGAAPSVVEKTGDADSRKEPETAALEIRSLERLRGYTSVLYKADALLYQYIKTLPGPKTVSALMSAYSALEEKQAGVEDTCEGFCPRSYVLKEDFFGSPRGTRLICVNVLPFHMDLVRVDGRLQILNVYFMGD
jgi:hypothetical protein